MTGEAFKSPTLHHHHYHLSPNLPSTHLDYYNRLVFPHIVLHVSKGFSSLQAE